MLKGISWNNYLLVIVVLTIMWYVFVGLVYYYVDLKELLNGKRKLRFRWLEKYFDSDSIQESSAPEDNSKIDFEAVAAISVNDYTEVDALIAQIKKSVAEGVQKNASKTDLEKQLGVILDNCEAVGDSGFRSAINELIVSECETVGSFVFTLEEVDVLWKRKVK